MYHDVPCPQLTWYISCSLSLLFFVLCAFIYKTKDPNFCNYFRNLCLLQLIRYIFYNCTLWFISSLLNITTNVQHLTFLNLTIPASNPHIPQNYLYLLEVCYNPFHSSLGFEAVCSRQIWSPQTFCLLPPSIPYPAT